MSESEEERELPELPHDVIVDILSRLPCKSLVKFRCVSKLWNSLIRSHKFAKLQFSRSIGDTSRQCVLLRPEPFCSINYEDLDEFFEDRFELINQEDVPPLVAGVDIDNDADLIGECNGLLCFMLMKRDQKSFLLWNPTTRECKEVRKNDVANLVDVGCMFDFDIRTTSDTKDRADIYGFGYDSISDDYKIVRLMSDLPRTKVVDVEIYMVGRRTWRKIEHPVSGMICIFRNDFRVDNCAFLNGACHWFTYKFATNDTAILRFDLGKEELEELTLPPYLSKSDFISEVLVLGGKLVLPNKINNIEMDIWIMNEYGVGSSFTKKMTVYASQGSESTNFVSPICFSKNDSVLIYDDGGYRLLMYYPESKTWKEAVGHWRQNHLTVYAETLFSPYHIPSAEPNLGETA
ncbi:unnamed protein product [Rhodiola kirilowii]